MPAGLLRTSPARREAAVFPQAQDPANPDQLRKRPRWGDCLCASRARPSPSTSRAASNQICYAERAPMSCAYLPSHYQTRVVTIRLPFCLSISVCLQFSDARLPNLLGDVDPLIARLVKESEQFQTLALETCPYASPLPARRKT